MSDSIEVMCDGAIFATLVNEAVPTAHTGRPKSETVEIPSDADFPSAPTKPKKRSRKKVDEVIVEID